MRPANLPAGTVWRAVVAADGFSLGLLGDDAALHEIRFLAPTAALLPAHPLAERAAAQIAAWRRDPDFRFALPLAPAGTAFQKRVWAAIAAIPRGQTRRYGDLARTLASGPRAVGQACGANPFPLIVPCHRVVAAGGLGGFAGAHAGFLIDVKRGLLAREGAAG